MPEEPESFDPGPAHVHIADDHLDDTARLCDCCHPSRIQVQTLPGWTIFGAEHGSMPAVRKPRLLIQRLAASGLGVFILLALGCGGGGATEGKRDSVPTRTDSRPPSTVMAAAASRTESGPCSREKPRRIKNPRGADTVIGRGPLLLGGITPSRPTPALVRRSTEGRVLGKLYFMLARRGPQIVRIRGWAVDDRSRSLLFEIIDDHNRRRFVPELVLRLRDREGPRGYPYQYQPSGIDAPSVGCYVVRADWNGGRTATRIDLTRLPKTPPRAQ